MYQNIPPDTSLRLCKTPMITPPFSPLFRFIDGGWHLSYEYYHIIREHGTSGYMLFFSLSAGGVVKIDKQVLNIPAGSITVLPPHVYHEYYTLSQCKWEFYWIHIGEEHIKMLEELINFHGNIFLPSQLNKFILLIEDLFPERFSPADSYYTQKTSQVIAAILHGIQEELYQEHTKAASPDPIINEILQEIEMNYFEEIDISKIASQNFISVQHLIRKFKQTAGLTPYAYLKKYRILKAKELLEHSNLTIKEIASQTGFKDVSNFIYQFRQENGISPGNYKKFWNS